MSTLANNSEKKIYTGGFFMDSYDKKGKIQSGHFPNQQRKIWNCTDGENIRSDVLGSYSGADEADEVPVQDADDL